jgi:hypothetical protein
MKIPGHVKVRTQLQLTGQIHFPGIILKLSACMIH